MHTIAVLAVVFVTSYVTSVAVRRTSSCSAWQVAAISTYMFYAAQMVGLGVVGATVVAAALTGLNVNFAKIRTWSKEQASESATVNTVALEQPAAGMTPVR